MSEERDPPSAIVAASSGDGSLYAHTAQRPFVLRVDWTKAVPASGLHPVMWCLYFRDGTCHPEYLLDPSSHQLLEWYVAHLSLDGLIEVGFYLTREFLAYADAPEQLQAIYSVKVAPGIRLSASRERWAAANDLNSIAEILFIGQQNPDSEGGFWCGAGVKNGRPFCVGTPFPPSQGPDYSREVKP